MTLTKPDFKLDKPNPYASTTTDAVWWLWLRLEELHSAGQLGGTYANKPGFHNKGNTIKATRPNDYSVRDKVNQSGPGMTHSSALDWTFPDAQSGHYANIDKYSSRLLASMLDKNDPRLDLVLFEFYGQADNDRTVEGYNEYREDYVSSDSSHLWHIHMSFLRSKCGDFWAMWALLTVLMGWSVAKWRASLPAGTPVVPAKPKPKPPVGIPEHAPGSRTLKAGMSGTDVVFVQKFIGSKHMGAADGKAGPKFTSGVKWYQDLRGLAADGVLTKGGPTWKAMGH
jgi:hypothetical protein